MTRGKREHTVATRVDDRVIEELDRYQRSRERENRVPLSRGLIVLQILEDWTRAQRAEREAEPEPRARVDRRGASG